MRKTKSKLTLLALSAICIVLLFTSISKTIEAYASKYENYSFETYIVEPGDTIWSIAREYKEPGQDIRELIYEIRKVNDISPMIQPGQELKIPVRK